MLANKMAWSAGDESMPAVTRALSALGPAYIKFGQVLSTRPDLVGEELSNQLRVLQDRLPPFSIEEAKNTFFNETGLLADETFDEFSEAIAAASIAQVHVAKIKDENENRDVAIKILRPDIEKLFNEELDALMLFAYIVENTISKAKRLKLVEVVYLLREITNIEMDLRFEAAAANELYENTKLDVGLMCLKFIGITQQKESHFG